MRSSGRWCRTICFPPRRISRVRRRSLILRNRKLCTGICLEGCRGCCRARDSRCSTRKQKQIAKMLAQLGKQIEKLDPTLKGTVERARKRIEFHVDKLRRKAGRAQDQKAGLISAHEQYLESLLDPHKGLQERELCLLPFLARWGAGGLRELQKLSTGKKIGHHFIVQLP